ncbi:MAG: hypothetical protein RID91_17825 [Azospirillaceae bacterium]
MSSDGDPPKTDDATTRVEGAGDGLSPGMASLHPWLRPLYRRVIVTVLCVIWLGVESVFGDPFFSVLAMAMCAYAAWDFFIKPARLDREAARSE